MKIHVNLIAGIAAFAAVAFWGATASATVGWHDLFPEWTMSGITRDRSTGVTYAIGSDFETVYQWAPRSGTFIASGAKLTSPCYGGTSGSALCTLSAYNGTIYYGRKPSCGGSPCCTVGQVIFKQAAAGGTETQVAGNTCMEQVAVDNGGVLYGVDTTPQPSKLVSGSWQQQPISYRSALEVAYDSCLLVPEYALSTLGETLDYNSGTWYFISSAPTANFIAQNSSVILGGSTLYYVCNSPTLSYTQLTPGYSVPTNTQQFTTTENSSAPEFALTNSSGEGLVYKWSAI